jgi:hypothetical protein
MPHSSIAKPELQGSSDERVTLVVKHRVKAGTDQAS